MADRDVDGGDDRTDTTRAREGEKHPGHCPVAEGVGGDGDEIYLRSGETAPRYERQHQPLPKLAGFQEELERLITENERRPVRYRLDYLGIFRRLQEAGFQGG